MFPDTLGFLYPRVDPVSCTDCGLCERVCQFNDHYDKSLNLSRPLAFAARHKDIDEIMKSRSGAVFAAASDFILEHGGVIYGAGFKDHFRVAHKRAVTKSERDEMRGSKYVQSDLTGVFSQVREDLRNGLSVLFSGTPCQTSGLGAFVGPKLREQLYLMDIVCHGVPGPYVWRDYLAYLEKKHHSRICRVCFRDKEAFGWSAQRESFWFENDRANRESPDFLYYHNISFRHSCSSCHFANLQRPSDLTIADYWGWERTAPTLNTDDKGCSLVICNTFKGKELFKAISDKMTVLEAALPDIMQNALRQPPAVYPKRVAFEAFYARYGFERTMKHFHLLGWKYECAKLKGRIFSLLRLNVK